MVKDKYSLTIQTTLTCPKRDVILELLEQESEPKIKTIIGEKDEALNKIPVFVDEVSDDNLYGYIKSAIKDEQVFLIAEELEELAREGNYEITLEKTQGKSILGTLSVLVQEGAAKQSSNSELKSELDAAIQRVINEGIVSEEDMKARMQVFTDNHVDEYLQLRIINKYRKYNKPVHKPSCIFQDPYLEDSLKKKREPIISEGLRSSASRYAIICEGEKSVGKNVYVETIAWLLNMPLYLITFSRQMSPASIYGEKTTDNSAAEALAAFDSNILAKAEVVEEKRKFALNLCYKMGMTAADAVESVNQDMTEEDKETLAKAAQFRMLQAQSSSVNIVIDQSELYDWLTDGGLMVFNEMNMCEANFFASFTNQLLDGTGFLFVPGRGEVPIHKDCVLFGTQNAEYEGTEQQNEATMSRFGCITFPQPKSITKQLIAATNAAIKKGDSPNASLSAKYFEECQDFYNQCRSAVNKEVITNACLNIRGFVRALTAVAESNGYAKLKRQIEIHVINTCPLDDRLALITTLEQKVTL